MCRRRRVHLYQMAIKAIFQREIQVAQNQRGGIPHLVAPSQGRPANVHFPLLKHPIGKTAVRISRVDGNPAYVKVAVARSPHGECGSCQLQPIEARLEYQ